MTKVSRKQLNPEDLKAYTNNLWSIFTLFDDKVKVRSLFKDLFTHTESKMLAKRMEIARRLIERESYDSIQRELNVTSATIATVSNILAERGEGLRYAHQQLKALENRNHRQQVKLQKRLENPFLRKMRRETVLGAALKVGVKAIDKQIIKSVKRKSAQKELDL